MTDAQTFRLVHAAARDGATRAVKTAPDGYVCVVRPPNRSLDQNALLHDALSDIASQVEWKGHRFTLDVWKRLCMASWIRERGGHPEMIPALDGNGFDIVYERTSKLTVGQMSEFLEWVTAFGAQNAVTFGKLGTG
jgi:hypothetical protein